MHDPRSEMARICRLAYERRLLDSAGGNLSVRADDCVYLSRRYAGARQQWELTGDDFLVCDLEGNRLGGHGDLSRETAAHLACYRAFPEAGCVFHAHPLDVMVFVSAGVPIPPSSEQTDKFGPIGFCQHAPAHSHELAHYVVEGLRPQADQIPQHAIAILVPRHGIFVVGKDLNAAYDGLERIDRAAYMALMARLLRVG